MNEADDLADRLKECEAERDALREELEEIKAAVRIACGGLAPYALD